MLFVNAQWTKSNWYPLNKKRSPHHVEQAPDIHNIKCHAPRERVSWNGLAVHALTGRSGHAPRERVSWNRFVEQRQSCEVRSRSTWACELKFDFLYIFNKVKKSRSTWACELKSRRKNAHQKRNSHAPRERVSWNGAGDIGAIQIYRSRSTWACELKLVVIRTAKRYK